MAMQQVSCETKQENGPTPTGHDPKRSLPAPVQMQIPWLAPQLSPPLYTDRYVTLREYNIAYTHNRRLPCLVPGVRRSGRDAKQAKSVYKSVSELH